MVPGTRSSLRSPISRTGPPRRRQHASTLSGRLAPRDHPRQSPGCPSSPPTPVAWTTPSSSRSPTPTAWKPRVPWGCTRAWSRAPFRPKSTVMRPFSRLVPWSTVTGVQGMAEWILGGPVVSGDRPRRVRGVRDPRRYKGGGGGGLFAHDSEHASFQVVTPGALIRLSHGRLHRPPVSDFTDQFDPSPDHRTWQMDLDPRADRLEFGRVGYPGQRRREAHLAGRAARPWGPGRL